jgi:hypothetical protein
LDFYTPIFIKHNPEYASRVIELTICEDSRSGCNILAIRDESGEYIELAFEEISDDMLNEMLTVVDNDDFLSNMHTQKGLIKEYGECMQGVNKVAKNEYCDYSHILYITSIVLIIILLIALISYVC